MTGAVRVVGVVGSPAIPSRSRRLVEHALVVAAEQGAETVLVDLTALEPSALLGRVESVAVRDALEAVGAATIVCASTPTYRASFSGVLKCFLDLLPDGGLAGKVAVPIATGTDQDDLRAAGRSLRSVFTSLGASIVTAGAYAVDGDFTDGEPSATACKRVGHAVAESLRSASHLNR